MPQRDDQWRGVGTGWAITSSLIGAIVTLGALGFLVDLLAGTRKVFLPIGVVVGGGLGVYVVYLRWGRGEGGGG
jgi:F0F1-type ATP synthase assembly protein I